MKSEKKQFTLIECVLVVTILVFVAAVAVQNVLHSLKLSEEKTVHAAATDYSSVKNMYAGQDRVAFGGASVEKSRGVMNIFDTPAR